MSQQELLKRVIEALDGAGIEYMLTGSVVSSLQGEPRVTHAVDIVVAAKGESAKPLLLSFPPPRFYLDEVAIAEAIREQGMFSLIDTSTADKVDFWILTGGPFDRSRFARRRFEDVASVRVAISSPEDTILAKLRWAKLSGGSEKQFTDALRVYEIQFGQLDMDYLHRWARELGVEAMLQDLEKQAEQL